MMLGGGVTAEGSPGAAAAPSAAGAAVEPEGGVTRCGSPAAGHGSSYLISQRRHGWCSTRSPVMIRGMEPAGPPLDLSEVARLVTAFDDDSVALEGFHHRQHLIVAAHTAATRPPDVALGHVRRGLLALLARHGKDGYHETVTAFWMHALRARLLLQPAEWSLEQRLGDVVAWAETTRPLETHYSCERLADPVARQTFLEPDLLPFDVDGNQ